MSRRELYLLLAAGFLILAGIAGITRSHYTEKLAVAQHQIDALADTAALAKREAAVARDSAQLALDSARLAAHTRDSLDAVQRAREARAGAAHKAADAAIQAAPDTCAPVIAALQAENAAMADMAAGYFNQYRTERDAHERTKVALTRATSALQDAERSLAGLAAGAKAVELPRRSLLARLAPQTSLGCTAGLDPVSGKFAKACGATVGWKVTL